MTAAIEALEAIQVAAAEACADEIYLDCAQHLGDPQVSLELLEVSRRDVGSCAFEVAIERGFDEAVASQFSTVAVAAFELRWARLARAGRGGVA